MIARRPFLGALLSSGAAVAASGRLAAAPLPLDDEARLGRLLAGLDRTESLRAVKRLQASFAQYVHHGLWDEIGALFAADGTLAWDGAVMMGPPAIAAHLRKAIGGGMDGLPAGTVHAQLLMTPVVTLSPSGEQARGRWHEVRMASGPHAWAASLLTADYARLDGRWRITRLVNHPIFAGPFDTGWRNLSDDLPVIPYAYTPDSAGRPETGADAAPQPTDRLSEVGPRLAALAAEDAARNLQHIYGYYIDRKMWDDVADLFAPEGVLTIDGVGRFQGRAAILQALERDGPAGLRHGELNDHPQFNLTVEIAPSGVEARVRGLDLGMTGRNGGDAAWTFTTFDNRFLKRGDTWAIAGMRLYPDARADYYKGWDGGQSATSRRIAAFPVNPASGMAVRYPANLAPVSHPFNGEAIDARPGGSIAEAETALARAAAFDAIENISSALGQYLNDSRWYELSRLFTVDGWRKSPSAGYYQGRDRIWQMQMTRNGPLRRPRAFIPLHLRIQPVIHVAPDGRSAKLRTRLLQFNSANAREGSMTAGMYEDQLAIEDGIWRFSFDDIDHIWLTESYAKGWARLPEGAGQALSRSPAALLQTMPPDRPIEGRAYPPFPAIDRLWFHYRNPVSGRTPPNLLP